MKRLKKYEAFDNSLFDFDEFSKTIKSLFMDLYDRDYTIKIFPSILDMEPGSVTYSKITYPRVEIRKLNNDQLRNWIWQPLWTNDDEKMYFDEVILGILRYVVSEGFTYECKVSSLYPNSPGIKLFKINLIPKK